MSELAGRRASEGRVDVPNWAPIAPAPEAGTHIVEQPNGRRGVVRVPSHQADRAIPLIVFLHGAGGHAERIVELLGRSADDILVVAPQSQGSSWDVIRGGLGVDVASVEALLRWVTARWSVDRNHVAIGGFSDGASYALTLGLANGGLFTHVVAFSPGFQAAPRLHGKPLLFVSHGVQDPVLPVELCSRKIVSSLAQARYQVTYDEFDGEHTVPPATAERAIAWFLNGHRAVVRSQ